MRVELRLKLGERGGVGTRPVGERGGAAGLHLLPEPVREQHGALRMPLRGVGKRIYGFPDAAFRLGEALYDVPGDIGVGEPAQAHRHGLAVERALLVLEQLAHQARLRPGEHERRHLALELDVTPQDGVHLLDLRDVLELVEHDQGAEAAALLEAERQIEQRVQRGEGVGPRAQLQPRADPERAEREAEPGALQELLDPRTRLPLQLPRVRALEPDCDVGHREDAVEVDQDRDHPFLALGVAQHAPEQAGLAVLPRRVEPHVVPADGGGEQALRLLVAVDHVVGRDRVGVDEGVDVGDHGAEESYRMVP